MSEGPNWKEPSSCANEKIFEAETTEHLATTRELFEEYARSLDFDLGFQDFTSELTNLPGAYAAPNGCILLAAHKEQIVGCVGLRRWDETVCEMKRLYVKPELQGLGIGRSLAQAILLKARVLGYKRMRLDTLSSMRAANELYASLGFRPIEPYRYNPLPNARFFELTL
jgi:ribosomal protein S18 acetylase RimI-like enzyme